MRIEWDKINFAPFMERKAVNKIFDDITECRVNFYRHLIERIGANENMNTVTQTLRSFKRKKINQILEKLK